MGIFDRLGDVLRSYLNTGTASEERPEDYADPDLTAAMDELDEFLGGRRREKAPPPGGKKGPVPAASRPKTPPEELRPDYAELGLPFGAPLADCKAAYKKLLKIHHPDRHAGHAENTRKATAKSARINAAFDRIEKWAK